MDANTIAMMSMIMGSWVTIFATILWQSDRHANNIKDLDTKLTGKIEALDTKFTGKIEALDTKFTGKIEALDTKFTGKIDAMGHGLSDARERLARIEGYLMAPEDFRVRGPQPSAGVDPSPDAPPPDHRAAS